MSDARTLLHELNNLLAVIVSYSELLAAELPEDDPHRPDAAEIETAARRAAEISAKLMVVVPRSE